MELYVLSDKQLSSMNEWQQAIDKEGFDLRIAADRSFETLKGHLPCVYRKPRLDRNGDEVQQG